jgi:hypothetical protein
VSSSIEPDGRARRGSHGGSRAVRRYAWIGAGIALCSAVAAAADTEVSPQIWLNPGFLSAHADRSQDYRETNIGFGVELSLAPDHGFFAGNYINSNGTRSRYGMYQWRPLHWQIEHLRLSAGLIAGAIDGYQNYHGGGWFFGALPMLFLEGDRLGANFLIVPASAPEHRVAAIQLKIRVR